MSKAKEAMEIMRLNREFRKSKWVWGLLKFSETKIEVKLVSAFLKAFRVKQFSVPPYYPSALLQVSGFFGPKLCESFSVLKGTITSKWPKQTSSRKWSTSSNPVLTGWQHMQKKEKRLYLCLIDNIEFTKIQELHTEQLLLIYFKSFNVFNIFW